MEMLLQNSSARRVFFAQVTGNCKTFVKKFLPGGRYRRPAGVRRDNFLYAFRAGSSQFFSHLRPDEKKVQKDFFVKKIFSGVCISVGFGERDSPPAVLFRDSRSVLPQQGQILIQPRVHIAANQPFHGRKIVPHVPGIEGRMVGGTIRTLMSMGGYPAFINSRFTSRRPVRPLPSMNGCTASKAIPCQSGDAVRRFGSVCRKQLFHFFRDAHGGHRFVMGAHNAHRNAVVHTAIQRQIGQNQRMNPADHRFGERRVFCCQIADIIKGFLVRKDGN